MEENNSITKNMTDYYDYDYMDMETQFFLLTMNHIEYKIGKVQQILIRIMVD